MIEAVQWLGPAPNLTSDEARTAPTVDYLEGILGVRLEPDGDWGIEITLPEKREPEKQWTLRVWNEPERCWVRCPVGHWIIKGVKGEFYPCAPDIFEATYEPVDTTAR